MPWPVGGGTDRTRGSASRAALDCRGDGSQNVGGDGVGGLGRRDRILALLVPAVLAIVAVHQITTAQTEDLTPWKGGGFGMFATADHPDTRALRTYLVTDSDRVPVDVEAMITLAEDRHLGTMLSLRSRPGRNAAEAWTAVLADRAWVLRDGAAQLADREGTPTDGGLHLDADGTALPVETVRIEVWRSRYQRTGSRAVPELVRIHEIPDPGR